MSTKLLPTLMIAAAPLATGGFVIAEDHEPMQLTDQDRSDWVQIEDPFWGVDPHYAAFDGTGSWSDSGEVSESSAQGSASQWTRIDDDFIGGFLASSMYSFGGLRRDAGASMWASFEVDRTGRIEAVASFGGYFAENLDEAFATMRLDRLDEDGNPSESIIDWGNHGTAGMSAEREESMTGLLRPGMYRFFAETRADVLGHEIQPNAGEMQFYGSIELTRLPDCGEPGAGSCDEAKETPSCNDSSCCEPICAADPFCCENQWDSLCVEATAKHCGPCPGDLNGDGAIDGADQGLLFAAWGPQSPTFIHPADLNGDMVVNGEDLGLLMAEWGDC